MITKDNLKEIFEDLDQSEIEKAMDGSGDYVALEIHIFSTGSNVTLKQVDYETGREIERNGNVFCDKDDLLRLYGESEAHNEYLENYL